MSKQSGESSPVAVDSSASNINEQDQAPDRGDTEIVTKVGEISLEGDNKMNHKEPTPLVSTSVSNNENSKDGILEGEEGELDYEEDEGEILEASDNKQETPKKTPNKEQESDGEEGELEDGEVNSDGEEGEILSDQDEKDDLKKKKNIEEGEINEDDLEEGEVRDADPYSSNQGSRVPRKLCRYFVSGSCTWGVSCRFLHPGVNDKGAYQMLPHPGQYPVPYVRPPPPPFPLISDAAPTPGLQVATADLLPEDEDDLLGQPEATADVKAVNQEKETAWERGIRLAKENKKAALLRKKEDTDFEQKRMLLSISVDAEDEEGNKENQAKKQETRDRSKKDDDGRGPRSSRWRDSKESSRYYNDRDKKKRRSRRSPSSSPERSKYDRRRDEKDSSKTSDKEQDIGKRLDKDRPRKSKTDELKKERKDKDISSTERRSKEPSVSSTKDVEPNSKENLKKKVSKDSENELNQEETGEGEKSKGKGFLSISNNRLANDDWHDPWQRTTSPKRRSPRRRSTTSSYSSRSRSRSSSSSSASSRSSRSRSRTPSSTGSESRSSSRSVSRSPSRSPSQTPSGTSSRSMSRSETPSSQSDRSSTSSRGSSRKDRYPSKTDSNKASSRNQTLSPSGSGSESHSDSESDSDRPHSPIVSPSPSPHPPSPPPPPRSPSTRVPRGSAGAPTDRSGSRYRKDRYDVEHKYRQSHVMGWDRRNRGSWHDPYGRGGRVSPRKDRDRDRDRRRRSRTPPGRRDADQRRALEEASQQSHNVDNTLSSRPMSSRDHYRRGSHSDNGRTSSDGSSNTAQAKSRSSNIPSNDSWSAERRKQSQSVWMGSGSVRYTGHKDIKLTLNKSAGKAPSSTQSSSSRQPQHSPPRQAEASSSSSGTNSKDPEKKRWAREPESSQRHSSPKDDVTSSQAASKPIKRAADSVLTPRHVETQSNKRNIEESTSKRADDKRMESRPLKRSADSAAANTKRTLPENIPIKQSQRDSIETPDAKSSHASNTSRREELLRELKAVEDAIARKRARIE